MLLLLYIYAEWSAFISQRAHHIMMPFSISAWLPVYRIPRVILGVWMNLASQLFFSSIACGVFPGEEPVWSFFPGGRGGGSPHRFAIVLWTVRRSASLAMDVLKVNMHLQIWLLARELECSGIELVSVIARSWAWILTAVSGVYGFIILFLLVPELEW
jgi:hypothetical protein